MRPRRRAVWVLALLAAGLWLGRSCAEASAPVASVTWFGVAMACCGGMVVASGVGWRVLACAAVVAFGAGWQTHRMVELPRGHVGMHLTDAPRLATVRGVVASPVEVRRERRGRLARFSYASASSSFELGEVRIVERDGVETLGRGLVRVLADGDASGVRVGDLVEVTGFARRTRGAMNPGQYPIELWARQRGLAGDVRAPASAVRVLERVGGRDWAARVRERAGVWLAGEDARTALAAALLLGRRDDAGRGVNRSMMRLGLAHLLAISGLHLGILAWFVVTGVRLTGERGRLEGLLLAGVLLGYALILPARAPVVRATAMIVAFVGVEWSGRRYDRVNLLAWIGVGLLLWRPLELWSAGAQLSFGVVWGLLLCSEGLRVRLFGVRRHRDRIGALGAAGEWLKTAFAGNLCAWLIATPIVALHFGIVSPWAPLGTLLLMPLVVVVLILGYVAMALSLASPAAGAFIGAACLGAAGWIIGVVDWMARFPVAAIDLPRLSVALASAWVVVLASWMRGPTTWRLRIAVFVVVGWTGWGLASVGLPRGVVMRLDSFAVGDGSCHLIRSGNDALLFDCGGSSFTLGERELPDALRAVGAWRVRTVIISHPNIDHYLALPDMVERLGVRRVLVGDAFMTAARDADGPVRAVLDGLEASGVRVAVLHAGDVLRVGRASAVVLSPPAGSVWRRDNDASLVVCFEAATDAGPRRVLMTGDIQAEAMLSLSERFPALRADVLEAPHHGSAHGAAYEWVAGVDPSVVVQSTGPRRLGDERWDAVKTGRAWMITARDGAIVVEIGVDGSVTHAAYR